VPDHGVWRWFVEIPLRCGKPDVAISMWRHMQAAGFELEDPLLSEMKAVAEAQPIALEKLARAAGINSETSTEPPK
jgi:pentatricopeptide repeat protein